MARKKSKQPRDPYERVCGNCQHYRHPDPKEDGECFFNPPVVLLHEEDTFTARPWMPPDEPACGRFTQRLQS